MKTFSSALILLFVAAPLLHSCGTYAQTDPISVPPAPVPPAPAPPAPPVVATPKPQASYPPERAALWEDSIARFEQRDRTSGAPEPGGIVFVGSSSVVGWSTLAADFPALPVINRGFGGSEIQDSTHYAERIILPYRPRTVVLYAGDNDIAAGHTVERVVEDFQTFARQIHAALPDTRILFISIKPSPARWTFEPRMVAANKEISDWIGTQPNMVYIDVHSPMLGTDGMPRPELYVSDKLHMTPEGYRLWTGVVSMYLK